MGDFRWRREEISPLKIVPAAELATRQAAGGICVGPEMEQILFPSASMVGQLAGGRINFLPGDRLEPIYLRGTTFVKAPPSRVL